MHKKNMILSTFTFIVLSIILFQCTGDGAGSGSGSCNRDSSIDHTEDRITSVKIVAYLATWNGELATVVNELDLNKITHINIAFMNPDTDGIIFCDSSANDLKEAITILHNNNIKVKVLIALSKKKKSP